MSVSFLRKAQYFALGLIVALAASDPVYAGAAVDDISSNIVISSARLPGLVTAFSYLLAIFFGVMGVLKLKDHVINPTQVPLKASMIRFIAGGALLTLPIVLEAARISITGNVPPGTTYIQLLSAALGNITGTVTGGGAVNQGFNQLLGNIITSIDSTPGIVTAASYLLGLVMIVGGILKIKDHVETPEQVQIKEGVIRLLIAGALFTLPVIYLAAENTITGTTAPFSPFAATITSLYSTSTIAPVTACAGGTDLGGTICRFVDMTGTTPGFLTSISYLFGVVLAVWALLKIRDHVLNPNQTSVWEGASRLIAAGAFFAMPYVAFVLMQTVETGTFFDITNYYNGATVTCAGPLSLDMSLACFMQDIMAPMHILANHFAMVAGVVFIMIGISRLMKSAQDGPRGPGGMGTMMTFIVAGILLSYNTIISAFSVSIAGDSVVNTNASLVYTTGMTAAERGHVEIVIAAVLQFLIIVGIISFIRGWFIVRQVAEGNSQASMMAGVTHIVGGALAINLGPLLTAVQQSLGITGVGVSFL